MLTADASLSASAPGNEGGGTFHAAVFENDGDIAFALIDEPFEDVPQGGPDLRPPKLVRITTFRSCGQWSIR